MSPIAGHAFASYDRSQSWTPRRGTWTVAFAVCECGETTRGGVDNLSAAREWHREHKAALIAATPQA